jgi:uroporphyrinogen decarboxylase
MKSIERLRRIAEGGRPDRTPFVPSIYEHGAALIGVSPAAAGRDPTLMAAAALEGYGAYQHDLVTVGIDIYNVEAEAFGCAVSPGEDGSIPGIQTHPLAGGRLTDAGKLAVPRPGSSNRLGLVAEAAGEVARAIGDEVWVYGCMAGPFSQAVELRGFEELIADIAVEPEKVHALLARTAELSLQQAERLSRRGCGVYLYESWATLPLIDPRIFAAFVVPYNQRVISAVLRGFKTPPPAVIMGGDTTVLTDFFLQAGSSLMVADYNADFDLIRERTEGTNMLVRGCVDPKQIERGEWDAVARAVDALARKAQGMPTFLWGCGCVSLHTPRDHVLRFKDLCLTARS